MFVMPACLQASTALIVCLALCRRPMKFSIWSSNVCVPMLMRLMGVWLMFFSQSLFMSSGFASMVTSASGVRVKLLCMASKIALSNSAGSRLGVPPPIYNVFTREHSM